LNKRLNKSHDEIGTLARIPGKIEVTEKPGAREPLRGGWAKKREGRRQEKKKKKTTEAGEEIEKICLSGNLGQGKGGFNIGVAGSWNESCPKEIQRGGKGP